MSAEVTINNKRSAVTKQSSSKMLNLLEYPIATKMSSFGLKNTVQKEPITEPVSSHNNISRKQAENIDFFSNHKILFSETKQPNNGTDRKIDIDPDELNDTPRISEYNIYKAENRREQV